MTSGLVIDDMKKINCWTLVIIMLQGERPSFVLSSVKLFTAIER